MPAIKHFFLVFIFSILSFGGNASPVLQDFNGQKISFEDLRGKWVFINYWASWCHPCLMEIPELNHFYDKTSRDNVVLFGVNYEGVPLRSQQKLVEQLDIHYPSLQKDPAEELQLGDIRGVPATFVFNPRGELVDALYGSQTVRSLQRAMM